MHLSRKVGMGMGRWGYISFSQKNISNFSLFTTCYILKYFIGFLQLCLHGGVDRMTALQSLGCGFASRWGQFFFVLHIFFNVFFFHYHYYSANSTLICCLYSDSPIIYIYIYFFFHSV